MCHACSGACQCVRKKMAWGGERGLACCAHPSSTTIRRAPPPTKASGCWYALDASCLSGAVAAESDHGNTTVRAPPANASSADPEEESKKVRTGLTLLGSKTTPRPRSFTRTSAKSVAIRAVCCTYSGCCSTARSLLQQWGAARPFSGPSFSP